MAVDSPPTESDAFMQLLTDALRDGPGSPAWHEAITQLNASTSANVGAQPRADEYQLLCRAREHLESGKEYRSIRPGPGFTRQLMSSLEREQMTPPFWSAARLIAAAAVVLVIVGVAIILPKIVSRGPTDDPDVAALAGTLFGVPRASLESEKRLTPDWKTIGDLPVRFEHGLQVMPSNRETLPVAGGVALAQPIAADQPFAIETRLNVGHVTEDQIPEIVVSDVDDFSSQMATASHEFVWALQGKLAKVILPDGRLAAQDEFHPDPRADLSIRLKIGRRSAIVEMNGHAVWAGAIGLSPTASRTVAVRIIRRAPGGAGNIIFPSIQVLTAQ